MTDEILMENATLYAGDLYVPGTYAYACICHANLLVYIQWEFDYTFIQMI